MSSLQSELKQIPANAGYYIKVGAITTAANTTTFYANYGTDALPNISNNVYALSSVTSTFLVNAGSAVFRDMGKTLVSSSRAFRKVQLLTSTNSLVNGGTAGVGGVDAAPTNYITGYIELPGTGGGALQGSGSFTPVARLG
jgi:putative flippase GtrA